LGIEQVHSHRTYRRLAERLADAGFAALRFDYRGTGDSSGEELDPDRVPTWLEDVSRALDELQRRGKAQRVALLGTRLGALLACVTGMKHGRVNRLVLWGPFLSGRAYVREMRVLERVTRRQRTKPLAAPSDSVYAAGFELTRSTVDACEQIDLLTIPTADVSGALVISCAGPTAEVPLVEHLTRLGVAVAHQHFPGATCWTEICSPPNCVFDAIVSYLSDASSGLKKTPSDSTSPAACPPSELPVSGVTGRDGGGSWSETFVRFGPELRLFGILTRPADTTRMPPSLPAVLLLNSGTDYRVGLHRLSVKLARRWAAAGFAVLRFDLSGIGDSQPAEGVENDPFPPSAMNDVRAAVEAMSGWGTSFVLAGRCSGAQHAQRAAIRDPGLSGIVLLNPIPSTLLNQDQYSEYREVVQPSRAYLRALFSTEKWGRLLRGKVRVGHALKVLLGAALRRLRLRFLPDSQDWTSSEIRQLRQRSLNVLIVLGTNDMSELSTLSLDEKTLSGGNAQVRVARVEGDHSFSEPAEQAALIAFLTEYLETTYRAGEPVASEPHA
jgi:alpha-beta hydrolase superfamily lysophospholipase